MDLLLRPRRRRKDVNIPGQLVGYPEHFADGEFFRSDSRLNAAGIAHVGPRQHSTHAAAEGVHHAFNEGDEFCATHPFSGFAAFMD
jgi:hypothetical protein